MLWSESKRKGLARQFGGVRARTWDEMMPTKVIKVEWCLLMACFCIIAIWEGDWLHQSWGNWALIMSSMPFREGGCSKFKRQLAAGCMQWPWAIDSPKSRSIFRAEISKHFDASHLLLKKTRPVGHRVRTCTGLEKNTQRVDAAIWLPLGWENMNYIVLLTYFIGAMFLCYVKCPLTMNMVLCSTFCFPFPINNRYPFGKKNLRPNYVFNYLVLYCTHCLKSTDTWPDDEI
jgi:hypothetical protein